MELGGLIGAIAELGVVEWGKGWLTYTPTQAITPTATQSASAATAARSARDHAFQSLRSSNIGCQTPTAIGDR